MTEKDLGEDAHSFADAIMALTIGMRGPTAVAGIALALAGAAHLAECGPDAARTLFDEFYRRIEKARAEL